MAKEKTKKKDNIFKEMKKYWNTPAEGKHVPYIKNIFQFLPQLVAITP